MTPPLTRYNFPRRCNDAHFEARLNLWRITYMVCAVFVCSYGIFDLLDLDGSDFPFNVRLGQNGSRLGHGS